MKQPRTFAAAGVPQLRTAHEAWLPGFMAQRFSLHPIVLNQKIFSLLLRVF
jgi:hypothetical protein